MTLRYLWPLAAALACGGAAPDANPEFAGPAVTRVAAGDSLGAIARTAAFAGVLPCPDCEGIETQLLLHPDGSFRGSERYRGRDSVPEVTIGRWLLRNDSIPRLTLIGGSDGPRYFAAPSELTLRALDHDGAPIETQERVELVRISASPTLSGLVRLRGEFRYLADAATLVDCHSGRQFPVAGDSAFIQLQQAHGEHALGQGAAILADLAGSLEMRPGMEEGTQLETFVVDSFTVVGVTAECEAARTRAQIAVGDWELITLEGAELTPLEGAEQPSLRFVLSEPTMFGNAGCNRFTGRAVLRGLDLTAQPLAMTKRMCPDSLVMQREDRYGSVLGAGGWFRSAGDTLVLARGGYEVARFRRR